VILAGVEFVTRLGFDRISRLQRRIWEERRQALRISSNPGRPTILVAGNSLVEAAIDVPMLRQALGPSTDIHRYIVEQTTYFDWYYGLRRMFREGMRPAYVLIGFPASNLNSSAIRGDYSAYYLFDARGVIDYARAQRLDLTTSSSLLFAHYSSFYATRAEIRAFLMGKTFPAYGAALHNLTVRPAPPDTEEHVAWLATPRLRALDELTRGYGAKLIFVVIPTGQPGEQGIVTAGKNSGTAALLPLPTGTLNASDFADGFHLNARGRAIFTKALAGELETYLGVRSRWANP